MTPEQKAYYQYGKAIAYLESFREENDWLEVIGNAEARHWARIHLDVRDDCHYLVCHHAKLIRDAWRKRKVCRKWPPRKACNCENCLHGESIGDWACFSCILAAQGSYWEPRKEEK